MHPPSSLSTGQSKAAAVFRVTAGNFLEQFDFFLFGHLGPDFLPLGYRQIGKVFELFLSW